MTRQELLNRLAKMQEQGEDMNLEVAVTVSRKVADGRTRSGYRYEEMSADLRYVYNGAVTHRNNGEQIKRAQLSAYVDPDDWTNQWH